jgi:hypothetical protein
VLRNEQSRTCTNQCSAIFTGVVRHAVKTSAGSEASFGSVSFAPHAAKTIHSWRCSDGDCGIGGLAMPLDDTATPLARGTFFGSTPYGANDWSVDAKCGSRWPALQQSKTKRAGCPTADRSSLMGSGMYCVYSLLNTQI